MRYFLLVLIFAFMPMHLSAQYNYSTSSKKAIKYYEEALQFLNRMDYISATDLMKKAIKSDENFIEAHIVLAEICIEKGDPKGAIESYKNVIAIDPDFFPGMYFSLAQLEIKENKFEQAKAHLVKYLSYKYLKPISVSQAKKVLESCEFAIEAVKNPVPFDPVNLGDSINTPYDEYWPTLTADERTLVITRLLPTNNSEAEIKSYQLSNKNYGDEVFHLNMKTLGNVQEDFFVSTKQNDTWSKMVSMGEPLNSKGNEGAQTILVNGRLMYFTACNREDGKGRCDIYVSKKEGANWSEPTNLGDPVNTASWEAQPSISPDGKTLYFVSNRGGGMGQKDIWISKLRDDDTWTDPVNLGDKINTKGQEQSPFIHPDNKTLYFASEGRVGMGGFDLFKVIRNDDGSWGDPVNLGYPINTVHNEVGLIVNARGDKAYYSSDRFTEKGRDIFEFDLYKEARPQSVSFLKGVVFNADTKKKLGAHFELIELDTKNVIMDAESDPVSGEFLVCIPGNNDYALNVSKEGYLFYSDNFSLKGTFEINDPYLKDIPLKPIRAGEKIILRNIFYTTDSYELVDKSIAELTKLLEFLNLNPSLKIEISGHTDNVGTTAYNLELSENRAKSVYEYLVNINIEPARLSYKGYGESKPLNTNETEEGRAENRRTEIKILNKF